MSHALRHAWAVFATLLIFDVVFCAAWLLAIQMKPMIATFQLGDVMPLMVGFLLVPLFALMALAAGIARGVVKPDVDTGESPKLDFLLRPLVASFVVFLVVLAVGVLGLVGVRDDLILAAVGFFAVSIPVVSLTALALRRLSLRTLSMTAATVVTVAVVFLVAAEMRGRRALVQQRAEALKEIATERQRQQALMRPVFVEPALDANAADTYWALMTAEDSGARNAPSSLQGDLNKSLLAPAEPLPKTVVDALERSRADIDKLAEATRARRTAWAYEYEKASRAPFPNLMTGTTLAKLAIADGNRKAQAGDVRGAVDRYFTVLRFGTDLGDGPQIAALTGATIEGYGIAALARVARSPRGAPVLDAIDAGLTRLTPSLIDGASALRSERLFFAAMGPQDHPGDLLEAFIGSEGLAARVAWLIPWNAYAADAVASINATVKEFESIASRNDAGEWRRLIVENYFQKDYLANPNSLYRAALPGMVFARRGFTEAQAMASALRVAIGLERRRAAEGRYPEDAGSLPTDPLGSGNETLRYRTVRDGVSYVLYSVGSDHDDDGGKFPHDTVLPEAGWPREGK